MVGKWTGEGTTVDGKSFEVSSKPPRLPNAVQNQWNGYWGLDRIEERGRRREDRGDDPE